MKEAVKTVPRLTRTWFCNFWV